MYASTPVKSGNKINRRKLTDHFITVRNLSEKLCQPLEIEDFVVQPSEDVSPPKWHLGHTSWFFERIILMEFDPDFKMYHEKYHFIFNSYYEAFGERIQRSLRGTLSRPTISEVMEYRKSVTERTVKFLKNCSAEKFVQVCNLVILGINHEQQHQELFLMDIKSIFASNPLLPVYHKNNTDSQLSAHTSTEYVAIPEGVYEIGAESETGFAYDNEFLRHKIYLQGYSLSSHLVTCGEYLEFIDDNGYHDHRLWLSDGWDIITQENIQAPLYWFKTAEGWKVFTLSGLQPLNPNQSVCHVSYYEAAAYARWCDKRLPTEAEWEVAAVLHAQPDKHDNFMDSMKYHPAQYSSDPKKAKLSQMFGDVWEWTSSAYLAYPGYIQSKDALGEYNGKFMNNQKVLRGGSCVTPRDHFRTTYRNFFQSEKRWPFTGFRLAQDK